MERIFIIIAAIAFSMVTVTGLGVYFLSQTEINAAKNDVFHELAQGTAQNISTRTTLLAQTLANISQSPELINALQQGDMQQAKLIVRSLGAYLPGAMHFRLLLPSDTKPDVSVTPNIGYADLDLVKNTFQREQKPFIQGEVGKNRHLAMTQGIIQDKKVVAVILASIDFKELQRQIDKLNNGNIYLDVKQGDFSLFTHGNKELQQSEYHGIVNVDNTTWTISYWSNDAINFSLVNAVLVVILIPAFLTLFACYILYRKLEAIFIEDQRSALKAAKDILTGTNHSHHYPTKLKEMSNFISTILQFKRALDGQSIESEVSKTQEEQDLDSFFDSSDNSDFLGDEFSKYAEQVSSTEVGSVISLSDIGKDKQEPKSSKIKNKSSKKTAEKQNSVASIFRAYDIRGVFNNPLTDRLVYDIARAIGTEAIKKNISTIIVARDGRTSSPLLAQSLIDGLLSTGLNVLNIGIVPTPVLYFVAHHHEDHSGVMITGSHNPAEYNGLKIVIAGETLADNKIQALKTRIEEQDFHASTPGTVTENSMFSNEYIGVIADDIRIARPMKVVVDAGNGVAGVLGPLLLKSLGCEVIELFCEIDGNFPNHHPDPSKPENLSHLISAVAQHQADIGIAFDGDGDRLGVIDSNGKIIWPDRQIMFFSKHILAKKPGAEIIYDVKCSRHLANQIKKNNGRPVLWKTGHSYMKAKVHTSTAPFAGEMSGHLFFNDRWFGFDDGLYSAARLIELLSEDSRHSAEVFEDFPDSPNTPELTIELDEGENLAIMQSFCKKASFPDGKITDIDGLRVDFNDGFGLIRASNTTPALTLRFEGDTEETLKRIQDQFKEVLLKIKPDLSLPF